MKKVLLVALLMLMTTPSYAGLIAISTLSNDSQVSYTYFNDSFNTIKNTINGGIESINIKDATITIDDMASSANPGQREGDHFNAYTKTGMLPATDAALTSDISAGTSYVKSDAGILYRVVTAATSHTYTASKDTWVYIDINGAFQYVEQVLGTAQPVTPSNYLLLAKVVTSGVAITSVVDWRTLAISLGTSDDGFIKGMASAWVTSEHLSIDTGVVYNGSTRIAKITQTQLDIADAGDYLTGVSERAVSTWLYVYCDEDGNIKLDDNAPDYHDTSGNTTGNKYYYKNGTTYWRYIGETYLNATGSGNLTPFYDDGSGYVEWDTPAAVTTVASWAAWSGPISCAVGMPATSKRANFEMSIGTDADVRGAGSIRPFGGTDVNPSLTTGDIIGVHLFGGIVSSYTDNSRRIQHYEFSSGATSTIAIVLNGYYRIR
jgi:hypothetical protein